MDKSRKIKGGAVSYLNTKPLIYGFEKGMLQDQLEFISDYPANVARMLLNDEVDLGLVPVAIIPSLKEAHIISDCCIGCEGPVATVCLFSEVPLEKVERVLLDYQSRTSVRLARLMLKHYWKLSPELVDAKVDFRNEIKGTTAGLVIGDRAFEQALISPYIYDLGEAWINYSGLPFVFATWIANKQLPANFIKSFQEGTVEGFKHIPEIVANNPYDKYDLHKYYTENMSYELTEKKKEGMKLFLELPL